MSDIRTGIAQRIHTMERTLVRVACETSPINYSWEELEKDWREHYLQKAAEFEAYLKANGWGDIAEVRKVVNALGLALRKAHNQMAIVVRDSKEEADWRVAEAKQQERERIKNIVYSIVDSDV